jgi:hypothetical protein
MNQNFNQYPMTKKCYILFEGIDPIAYGQVVADTVNYMQFRFDMIKKNSVFHGHFRVNQIIRFRRPFDPYRFVFIPEDEKPFKSNVLRLYERSSIIQEKFYAKKSPK